MIIDLQAHSIYSDGYFSPTKLAGFLASQGVKIAALTDHNTLSGQKEFRAAGIKHKIKTIPGLELYVTVGHRRMNMLWYNYDENSLELKKMLLESQHRRRRNMRAKLLQLKANGFRLDVEAILAKYPDYVPINKVIDDFSASTYNQGKIRRDLKVRNFREDDLMREYFFNKQLGVLHDSYISLERILRLRKKIGGQIIFCHPAHHNKMRGNIVSKLKKMGIDGLEMLSPHHSYEAIMYIQYLAEEFDFITTGGSDFHKLGELDRKLKYSWQWFQIDSKHLRKIDKIIGK